MTAYGAVFSLENTIYNILCCSRFSLVDRSRQIIEDVYNELDPLLHILEKLDGTSPSRSRKWVNALDGRIKDALWGFEDSLESLLIQHIPSQSEILPEIVSIDLQSLQKDADSLIQKLKYMEKEYIFEVEYMPENEPITSTIGFLGSSSKMIGLSDQFHQVKALLLRGNLPSRFEHTIYGMAGIGKTALAMQIYKDSEIRNKYKCRAWVTVGRVPQAISQIARGIRAQLCESGLGDEDISDHCLEERLSGKKCLIVLDDVWEMSNFLGDSFLNIKNGCVRILFTGRHRKLLFGSSRTTLHEVRFLNEEESMDLLCDKVFGEESCPPQLHKAATKIAKLCEGLPLLIVTVADILAKSEQSRDPAYWSEVAERRNSVFTDAYNEISEVLFPSYEYLPQPLKMPFMFMGVFPQDYHTPPSKIIDMLTAEGLLPSDGGWLRSLASFYSLVLYTVTSVNKSSLNVSTPDYKASDYKTCWLHSSWRHVCRGEASKKKFYHVLNKLADASEESLKGQRGLCLENNMLFGIEEFCDLVRVNCASSARFLLFYGPYHQYPIPIDVGFMLLREIDALKLRFYTFPIEILSLVQLKYLALTCNGDLPATISKLFNLRVLIMHPHMKIRRCGAPSYVPIQIWDMKELKHIEILGKSLAAPSNIAQLEKLSTLVGVNASICTITELSNRIPNIRKLGIQIEQTPCDDHIDVLSCFRCISTLKSLKTLKFSITNPVVRHGHVFPVTPGSLQLPPHLTKLHLSGMGFPLEYMDVIGKFRLLDALKLRSHAFQGSRWDAQWNSFHWLKFLLIEDSDLVQLKLSLGFNSLKYLSMKHCYKLKEIHRPASLYKAPCLVEIELEDCNPLALTCVSQFRPGGLNTLDVIAYSSFYEKPTTIKIRRLGRHMLHMRKEWEVKDINEDHDFEGKGDDEYTNTSEEHEDTEGDDSIKILLIEERMKEERVLMRIQEKRKRKRVLTNMRIWDRKQRQEPTSRRKSILEAEDENDDEDMTDSDEDMTDSEDMIDVARMRKRMMPNISMIMRKQR